MLLRKLSVLLPAVMMLASMLVFSAPVFAEPGGDPHRPSCGVGKGLSAEFRADPTRPGAGEVSQEEIKPPADLCQRPFQQ